MTWLQSGVTGNGGAAAMRGPEPVPRVASHQDSTACSANLSEALSLILARKSSKSSCERTSAMIQLWRARKEKWAHCSGGGGLHTCVVAGEGLILKPFAWAKWPYF
jgi:hypothetical protein